MRKTWGLPDRLDAMRRALVWAAQIGIFALSGVAAFLLRFDLSLPPAYLRHLAYALPIWILVKTAVFRGAKLDRGLWRYVSVADLMRIALGNLTASIVSCILIRVIAPPGRKSIPSMDHGEPSPRVIPVFYRLKNVRLKENSP